MIIVIIIVIIITMTEKKSIAFQAYGSNVRELHLEYKTKTKSNSFCRRNRYLRETCISDDIKKCILGVRLIHNDLDSIEKIMEIRNDYIENFFDEVTPYDRGDSIYGVEKLKDPNLSIVNSYVYIRLLDFIKCTCDVRINSELNSIYDYIIQLTPGYQENYVTNYIKFLDSTHYSEHQKQSS